MSTCYLTTQGRVLIAKMLASDRLIYTRAVTSSTVAAEPDKLTAMPMAQQAAQFLYCERIDDVCRLTVGFSCKELEESYQLKMLGIYAKSEADQQEILYKVIVYSTEEERISLPAGADITYRFIITDAVSEGELSVEVVDDLAAPAEHVYNQYRHLFTQTNSADPATVDCGERNTFSDGQKIVFVPKIALTANSAKISCAGKLFDLNCVDLAGNSASYIFVANQTYVLTYRGADESFFYVKHNEIEFKNGVGHIWSGAGWQTIIEAGRIISGVYDTAPAGTLLCNGASIERSAYPELFAAIGTKFGAADASHFSLPNLGGRCLIGADSSHILGSTGGEAAHQLSVNELPKHSHALSGSTSSDSHSHTVTGSISTAGAHGHSLSGSTDSASHSHTPTVTQQNAGGHTPSGQVTVQSGGSHRHLNGMIDDSTNLFCYGYVDLSMPSSPAIAGDVNDMPNPHTGYTSVEGSHTHSAALSMDRVSDHGHNVKVTIPNGGSHAHTFNASAASGGSHSHALSLNIDSKRHSHTLSGSIGISGNNTAHNNMPPYMAVNYFIYTGRSLL